MESSEFFEQQIDNKLNSLILNDNGNFIVTKTQKLNRFIVTKELHSSKKESPIYIEAIEREFDIVVQLDHSNIIKYFDYSDFTISMEYVDGCNLNQILSKNPYYFTQERVIKFIAELLDVLSYLHKKNTYHHDIKPENILITHIGENLKLIDFGHAVTDQNISTWGGTKNYIPVGSNEDISPKRDFYAVSLILNQIVEINPKLKSKKMEKLIIYLSESDFLISIEKAKNILLKKPKRILNLLLPLFIVLILTGSFLLLKNKVNHFTAAHKNEVLANQQVIELKQNSPQKKQNQNISPLNKRFQKTTLNLILPKVDTMYLKTICKSYYNDFVKLTMNKELNMQQKIKIEDSLWLILQDKWWVFAGQYDNKGEEYKVVAPIFSVCSSENKGKISQLIFE